MGVLRRRRGCQKLKSNLVPFDIAEHHHIENTNSFFSLHFSHGRPKLTWSLQNPWETQNQECNVTETPAGNDRKWPKDGYQARQFRNRQAQPHRLEAREGQECIVIMGTFQFMNIPLLIFK